MKSGRSSNGKGHYWTIHPANLEDFSRGDFRRRRAQRRVRKSLGLTIPEEDEEDEEEEILTPPSSLSPVQIKTHAFVTGNASSNGAMMPTRNLAAVNTLLASSCNSLDSEKKLTSGNCIEAASVNSLKRCYSSQDEET